MADSLAELPQLTPFDVRALEGDDATICALDDDLRITYVNSAWRTFAHANGAPPDVATRAVGLALLDACPADVRPFYEELFRRARNASAPLEHSYECSSPTTFRRYRMRIFRCDVAAFVVAHSLSQAMHHRRIESPAIEQTYRNRDGIVFQCTNCRRVRRADPDDGQWDWVPDYVARMPEEVSHALCPLCVAYYHSPSARPERSPLPPAATGEASIVVAAGDPQTLALTARILRGEGHRVTLAGDRDALVDALEAAPFDLVVLGPGVQGMEGATAVTVIRALQPSIRVAVVLGAGSSGATVDATVLIPTPFTPQSLVARVRDALAAAGG